MKLISSFFFILLVFSFFHPAISQEHDSIRNQSVVIDTMPLPGQLPDILSNDNNMKLISGFMPLNWIVEVLSDTVFFICRSSVYKLEELTDTSIVKGKLMMKDTIRKRTLDTAMVIFRIEPAWAGSKVDDAKARNSLINDQIERLPARFKISHLREIINTPGFNPDEHELTEFEYKSAVRFLEEKQKLEQQFIQTPDFHTTEFSWFLIHMRPDYMNYDDYFPSYVLHERDNIIELFEKYAGK
jgi:hypothetical protein